MENDEDIWKVYPEYPFIEVSNLGKVRTKDRIVTRSDGRKQFVKGKILKQQLNPNGYMYVGFRVNGKYVNLRVHRMVAITFIPNPNNYPEVNHIDCDPTNNRWDNLVWCTHKENIAYRDKLGHFVNNTPKKPVFVVNLNSFKVFRFESRCEAARQLGVNKGDVRKVIRGKINKTGGCWFCNADKNAVEKVREKFGNEVANKVEKLMHES